MFTRISVVTLGFALAGATLVCAEVKDLSCDQTGPTAYKLAYALTEDSHKVKIFSSTDPAGKKARELVLSTSETNVTVQAGSPGQRVYFFIKPDHGPEREVSIRHLALQGTPNFRDLGGYETTDGRFVRWGFLYRSSVLTYLTDGDYQYLSFLGIRVICDFRTQHEVEIAPETWIPGSSVDKISLPIGSAPPSQPGEQPTVQVLFNPADTPEQLRQQMIETYGNFVFTSSDQYAAVFQQLKSEHLPLLYHCTGGADRTGVFSAFVLLTLGVPEETVLEDYALTRTYMGDLLTNPASQKILQASGSEVAESIKRLTPEQRKAMVTDPEYLRATLRRIDARNMAASRITDVKRFTYRTRMPKLSEYALPRSDAEVIDVLCIYKLNETVAFA